MNAETLLQLAEHCEKASGPDRELDAAIFLAAHPKIFTYCGKVVRCDDCVCRWRPLKLKRVWPTTNGGRNVFWYETRNGCSGGTDDVPYTASLDAAMPLVPEGWLHLVGNSPEHGDTPVAELWRRGRYAEDCIQGHAATDALALCAAALRARAACDSGSEAKPENAERSGAVEPEGSQSGLSDSEGIAQ